jgi:hypothetical protein
MLRASRGEESVTERMSRIEVTPGLELLAMKKYGMDRP